MENTKSNFELASTLAEHTDQSFWFIFAVSAICLLGITVFMLYCCVKYNHKNNPKATQIHGNLLLEIVWTVIPTILVMVMFYMTWEGYKISREVPEGAYEIDVTASQWKWNYAYKRTDGSGVFYVNSNSRPAEEFKENSRNVEKLYEPKSDVLFKEWVPKLVVPINTPVKLNLYSTDVIHSFSAPAFRVKNDCMPKPKWQKPNYLWFEATKEGVYDVNCTEFCGIDHSQMNSYIEVVSQEQFKVWLEEMTAYSKRVEEKNPGFMIWKNECSSCHTNDGAKGIGPTFKEILVRTRNLSINGKVVPNVKADLKYISESILKPKASIVEGYAPQMPESFGGFSEEKIKQIYEYMETLK